MVLFIFGVLDLYSPFIILLDKFEAGLLDYFNNLFLLGFLFTLKGILQFLNCVNLDLTFFYFVVNVSVFWLIKLADNKVNYLFVV
jgi:hypothetical protein